MLGKNAFMLFYPLLFCEAPLTNGFRLQQAGIGTH